MYFYDFSVICYVFLNSPAKPRKTYIQTLERKKKNYNQVLRRPSPPLHLAGGVLLGRAYRGCNGQARWVEEFESYLPMPVFGFGVAGIVLISVDGGGGARGSRTSSTRAPRERGEASGVGVVLGLRWNRPVHGEP